MWLGPMLMKNDRKSNFITPNLNSVQFPKSRLLENILFIFNIMDIWPKILFIVDSKHHFAFSSKL